MKVHCTNVAYLYFCGL